MRDLFKSVVGITILIVILFIFALIALVIVNDNERSQLAVSYGCTYLGTARDLRGVWFYNCNGEIILKPAGQHP